LRKRSQGGQAIVLFTLMVSTVLIPITGLAIDGGRGYLVRLKLSSAVDGGALAAARLLGTGSNATVQLANAKATAAQFVAANFPSNFFGANLVGTPYVCVDPGTDNTDPCNVGNGKSVATYKMRTVLVRASAAMPTLFMRILGMPTSTVASSGLASRRDVRVILVMDRSTSMQKFYTGINQTPPSIQDTALKFVNGFSGSGDLGGRDEVGLVVFGGSGIVAYPPRDITKDYTVYTNFTPPDNNFKLSGNIPKYITDLKSGSNTGTAEALYLAYMTLRADAATNTDLSTKLNVIVLFTDGLPNGVTAFANDPTFLTPNDMMNSSSGCTDLGKGSWATSPLVNKAASGNTNMIGWFAQWDSFKNRASAAHGLFPPMMAYAYTASGSYTGKGDDIDAYMQNGGADSPSAGINQMTPASTCGSTMNGSMASFPDRDIYGNYTKLGLAPAVGGAKPPLAPGGQDLYTLGDLYSNPTQCGGSTYQPTLTTNGCQIGLASWQAAAHQAWKIWNQIIWDKSSRTNKVDPAANQSQPVIFTIGFNHSSDGISEAPDMKLLQMIANDPASPVSFSNRVKGQAFQAKDPNAVDNAFSQITSQILRLSQ
jgi:Flp pilus assembly protein TadG